MVDILKDIFIHIAAWGFIILFVVGFPAFIIVAIRELFHTGKNGAPLPWWAWWDSFRNH